MDKDTNDQIEREADAVGNLDLIAMSMDKDRVLHPEHFDVYATTAISSNQSEGHEAYCLEFSGHTAAGEEAQIFIMWPRDRYNELITRMAQEHFPGEPCGHVDGHRDDR